MALLSLQKNCIRTAPTQAVQIGDPIMQKKMSDFIYEARDRGLYRFVTDNGAGGLSSSIGEMAELCGGCRMDLAKAPLKYAGMQPWEILVSEAQGAHELLRFNRKIWMNSLNWRNPVTWKLP